jgi:hypothetical protein
MEILSWDIVISKREIVCYSEVDRVSRRNDLVQKVVLKQLRSVIIP